MKITNEGVDMTSGVQELKTERKPIPPKTTIWFWERWLIKWAMHKLARIAPYMYNASYERLEKYGIADFTTTQETTAPGELPELYFLPDNDF